MAENQNNANNYSASNIQVLEGLGIRVMVDVPDSVAAYLNDPSSKQGQR